MRQKVAIRAVVIPLLMAVVAAWPAGAVVATGAAGDDDFPLVENTRNEDGIPRIDVIYRSKLTTDKKEKRTYHVRWECDFGDGRPWVDDDPAHVQLEVTRTVAAGVGVTCRSWSNDGRLLRTLTWAADTEGGVRTFRGETIEEAVPAITLGGPVMWVRGRPARYRLDLRVPRVPMLQSVTATDYPAKVFDVKWARPGRFTVRAAVTLRLTYQRPEGLLTLVNTYLVTREVEVLAPVLVR